MKSVFVEVASSQNDIDNIYNDGAFYGATGFGDRGFGQPLDQKISIDYSYIELETKSPDDSFTTEYGYIWIGELTDLDCIENIQPVDNSNDSATISRANTIELNHSYLYRNYQVTLGKSFTLPQLRDKMRPILQTGYAEPRPFIFDESFMDGEMVYGTLDSGKIAYDVIQQNNTDHIAQTTIGIREVN